MSLESGYPLRAILKVSLTAAILRVPNSRQEMKMGTGYRLMFGFAFLRQELTVQPKLAWNSLCSPG